jgi:hypothetical protein
MFSIVVGDTRPFAQLHDSRINWRQGPEAVRTGPERIGENLGVAAVVLGAGGREAITEAIELLWIDGVNPEATLHQAFDDGPCGTSIATKTASGVAPVDFKIQAAISVSPWPPCAKRDRKDAARLGSLCFATLRVVLQAARNRPRTAEEGTGGLAGFHHVESSNGI